MLTLFHWEPNGASARVMIALHEKGLSFENRFVDVLAFEQYSPEFLSISDKGQVPVLTVGGAAYDQASYLCEYLEDAYGIPPLMPADPAGRWRVREWQKYVDDYLGPSVSELAWQTYLPALRDQLGAQAEDWICRIPMPERRDAWRKALVDHSAERIAGALERSREAVTKVEKDLHRGQWLAGDDYSLADIAVFSYINYLPRVLPNVVSASATPLTVEWLSRVSRRPAVVAALRQGRAADPFDTAAPGPEEIRWG